MARRSSTRNRATRSRAESPAPSRGRRREAAQVEVVEGESAGDGGATGMAILTTLLLVAAILCVDALLGRYGEGVFF